MSDVIEKCPCTGKVCYASERDASGALNFFRTARGRHGKLRKKIPKRVYRCEFCGNYHLTHHKKWK